MKFVNFIILPLAIFFTLLTCTYFDPMMGYIFPSYNASFTLSYTGGTAALFEADGRWSYNNLAFDGTNVYLSYAADYHLYFARSKDTGHTWEKTMLLSDTTGNISMALRNGVLAIACVTFSGNQSLYCFRTEDGGNTFIKTDVGSAKDSGDCYTGVDCSGDSVFIAYSDQGSDNFADLKMAYSSDKGKNFTVQTIDSTSQDAQMSSSISYNPVNNKIYICYQYAGATTEDLRLATAPGPDFSTFSLAKSWVNTSCWSNSIISQDYNIFILYRSSPGFTYSADSGVTWPTNADVDSSTTYTTDVYMTRINSTLYAVYYDSTNHLVRMGKGASSLTVSTVASSTADGGVTGRKCSIAASDTGTIIFVSFVDNQYNLRLSKSTNGGASWNNE